MAYFAPAFAGLAAGGCRATTPDVMPVAPITATAPRGIDDALLGTPVDVHFRPLPGPAGRTLFPRARVQRLAQTYVAHEALTVRSQLGLTANLAGWLTIDASIGFSDQNRYGYYLAFQVDAVSTVDDHADMSDAPPGAMFYVAKIYWGHSYEAVFEGDRRAFNAAVGAQLGVFQGDVDGFASTSHLRAHFVGAGLRPNGGRALFARNERDIMNAYSTTGTGAPIFVEYRALPHRWLQDYPIPFDQALRVTVRFQQLFVREGGTWFSTPWRLLGKCSTGPSTPSEPTMLYQGDVEDAHHYSLNQTIELFAAPGELLDCTADGYFSDVFASGPIASGRSAPMQLVPGARFPLTISGRGRASYEVTASVDVQPQ